MWPFCSGLIVVDVSLSSVARHNSCANRDRDIPMGYSDVPRLHVPTECACGNAIEKHLDIPSGYPDPRSARPFVEPVYLVYTISRIHSALGVRGPTSPNRPISKKLGLKTILRFLSVHLTSPYSVNMAEPQQTRRDSPPGRGKSQDF